MIIGLPVKSISTIYFVGAPRSKRRRKRCKNCARLLPDDAEEFCDEQCQDMEKDRNKNKREDFLSEKHIQSTRDISKSKFISNCLYLKVNVLVPENLL